MTNLSAVDKRYDELLELIKKTFGEDSDRTKNLLKLYTDFEEQVKQAPASGKLHFHNAYEGGYLDHIFNVLACAKAQAKLYKDMGGIIDFTKEELIFSALHHDLGKLGLLGEPYYIVQDSDWHRNNRNEVFKHNTDVQYMTVNDRTIFILQSYGIQLTRNEFLAIKLTDGLYDKDNETYLKQYGGGDFPMRTNLHKIMHWGDHMAASIESDPVREKYTQ